VASDIKKTFLLRRLLIGAIIISFTYISTIFIYQYLEYVKVKERLYAAYAVNQTQSDALYLLFSTYSEADNLFRLYTVDFDKKIFNVYKGKLDSIRHQIDSLSTLPIENNPLLRSLSVIQEKDHIAQEFASLKKSVDNLIFLAVDSLPTLERAKDKSLPSVQQQSADSVVNKILKDTSFREVNVDTVVRQKQNLFNRIFNAKSDTILASYSTLHNFNANQIEVIHTSIENLITEKDKTHTRSLALLQHQFYALQQKERQLIQTNYKLLNNLKTGIDNLRELEAAHIRKAEQIALEHHQQNAGQFGNQLFIALSIMLIMIVFILYYQRNAVSYERRLQDEKNYASLIAEEKTSVLANISHEVRSPINSLLGVIDILKKNGSEKVISPEYLDSATHDISVINSTLNDILNLGKLEVGALNIKQEYFSPYTILMEVIELHAYQAKKKQLDFTYEISIAPNFQMYSSAFRFKQIVSNFVSNAIKYTNQGFVKVIAYVDSTESRNRLYIDVRDSGIGIAEDQQHNIFRQYYMADSKNKTGGFGLGLYISKLLAEQLHGDILLKSKLNQGSSFALILPIEKSRVLKNTKKKLSLSDIPKELRLVLIDDNHINILYLKHFFSGLSYVHAFDKATDALKFIRENPVDLVITDLLMPEVNGWDVLNQIKENESTTDVKVFAFTSDSLVLDTEMPDDQKYHFDAVLVKPINEHDLVSHILQNEILQGEHLS